MKKLLLLVAIALLYTASNAGAASYIYPDGTDLRSVVDQRLNGDWTRGRGINCGNLGPDDALIEDVEELKANLLAKIAILTEELAMKLADPDLTLGDIEELLARFHEKVAMLREEFTRQITALSGSSAIRRERCAAIGGGTGGNSDEFENNQLDFVNQARALFLESQDRVNEPGITTEQMMQIFEEFKMKVEQIRMNYDGDTAERLKDTSQRFLDRLEQYIEYVKENGAGDVDPNSGTSLRSLLGRR